MTHVHVKEGFAPSELSKVLCAMLSRNNKKITKARSARYNAMSEVKVNVEANVKTKCATHHVGKLSNRMGKLAWQPARQTSMRIMITDMVANVMAQDKGKVQGSQ